MPINVVLSVAWPFGLDTCSRSNGEVRCGTVVARRSRMSTIKRSTDSTYCGWKKLADIKSNEKRSAVDCLQVGTLPRVIWHIPDVIENNYSTHYVCSGTSFIAHMNEMTHFKRPLTSCSFQAFINVCGYNLKYYRVGCELILVESNCPVLSE